MEPSAVAARRTRTSLALSVAGALIVMTGVALIVIGEALKLEHPPRLESLIVPGVALVFAGAALGASAAVTILRDAAGRRPSGPPGPRHAPLRRAAGPPRASVPAPAPPQEIHHPVRR